MLGVDGERFGERGPAVYGVAEGSPSHPMGQSQPLLGPPQQPAPPGASRSFPWPPLGHLVFPLGGCMAGGSHIHICRAFGLWVARFPGHPDLPSEFPPPSQCSSHLVLSFSHSDPNDSPGRLLLLTEPSVRPSLPTLPTPLRWHPCPEGSNAPAERARGPLDSPPSTAPTHPTPGL